MVALRYVLRRLSTDTVLSHSDVVTGTCSARVTAFALYVTPTSWGVSGNLETCLATPLHFILNVVDNLA